MTTFLQFSVNSPLALEEMHILSFALGAFHVISQSF
jgi:hypothetical protein